MWMKIIVCCGWVGKDDTRQDEMTFRFKLSRVERSFRRMTLILFLTSGSDSHMRGGMMMMMFLCELTFDGPTMRFLIFNWPLLPWCAPWCGKAIIRL